MKGQEHKLKMAGLQAKTQAEIVRAKVAQQKSHVDLQQTVLKSLLSNVGKPQNGTENDNGQ